MDLQAIKKITDQLDPETIRSILVAGKNVLDQLVIQVKEAKSIDTPKPKNYLAGGGLSTAAPKRGWLTPEVLDSYSQKMTEAIATEKWEEGFIALLQIIAIAGAI